LRLSEIQNQCFTLEGERAGESVRELERLSREGMAERTREAKSERG